MRVFVLLVLCVFVVGSTAHAGSEHDPEITEACEDGFYGWEDICAAWLAGVWEPVETPGNGGLKLVGIRGTIQVAGRVEDRRPAAYALGWTTGGCRHTWSVRDVTVPPSTVARFWVHCGGQRVTDILLEPSDFTIVGREVSVTLRLDDPLSQYASSYEVGSVLSAPRAETWLSIVAAFIQVAVSGDMAGPGRSFVVGQDNPAAS
jgi:hypothetical protein